MIFCSLNPLISDGSVSRSEVDKLKFQTDQLKRELAESTNRLTDERLAKSQLDKNFQILKSELDIERALREKVELEYSAAKVLVDFFFRFLKDF